MLRKPLSTLLRPSVFVSTAQSKWGRHKSAEAQRRDPFPEADAEDPGGIGADLPGHEGRHIPCTIKCCMPKRHDTQDAQLNLTFSYGY